MWLSIWLTHARAETSFSPSFKAHSLCTLCCLCAQAPHPTCFLDVLQYSHFKRWFALILESNQMHSTHCMAFGAWCSTRIWGTEGGSCPPSPYRKEQQGPWSPPSLGEATSWFQCPLDQGDTGSPFPSVCFLLGRSLSSSLCHLRSSSPTCSL